MEIHLKLKVLFVKLGLTQSDLHRDMGVSRVTINRFLNGRANIRYKDFLKILEVAGIDLGSQLDSKIMGKE